MNKLIVNTSDGIVTYAEQRTKRKQRLVIKFLLLKQ